MTVFGARIAVFCRWQSGGLAPVFFVEEGMIKFFLRHDSMSRTVKKCTFET